MVVKVGSDQPIRVKDGPRVPTSDQFKYACDTPSTGRAVFNCLFVACRFRKRLVVHGDKPLEISWVFKPAEVVEFSEGFCFVVFYEF